VGQQAKARQTGLMLALLCSLAWMVKLTAPLFAVFGFDVSGRDLILLGGGLFLIVKSTMEIHEKLEGEEEHANPKGAPKFSAVIRRVPLCRKYRWRIAGPGLCSAG
jgi:predicted tellurium resistance membrane protein TerC